MPKSTQRNIFKLRSGFSLVELTAVLGITAAGALGLMQLQSSQVTGQKKVEAKYEATTIANSIGTLLLSKAACEQTFNGAVFSAAQNPQPFNTIRASTPNGVIDAYTAPLNLGNINISRFEYQLNGPLVGAAGTNRYGSFNVAIVFSSNSKLTPNPKVERIEVPYSIKLETDPTGRFLSCYSDISDIGDQVSARACASVGGTFDPAIPRCSLTRHPGIPNQGTGSNLVLDNYRLLNYASFRDEIYPRIFRDNFVYRMQGGDTVNGSISMQNNAQFRVENVTNDADAVNKRYADQLFPSCPTGTVGIFTDNGMRCENLLCQNTGNGTQQYLAGFNPNGSKICHPLVNEGGACSNGGSLTLGTNGALEYECCTPECTNPANYCSNEVFPSANSCGNCIGTKPASDATWGAWVNTGNSRTAGGATCSAACGGGVVATEIEQVRVCNNNNQCGGATCAGNSQQWILGPNQACNTHTCPAPGKCKGWGDDTSNMFIIARTDEVQNGCRTQYRDVYFDIVVSQFKRGNIYSITQGMTFSEEAKTGDTPQTVLNRLAAKINAQNMTYPTLCMGAGSTVVTNASVVSSNRLKYHINWQHQPGHSASRSCNNLDEATCTSTPSCSWDTTSPNLCTGWNYTIPQGTCSGTYYENACAWNGMGSGSDDQCRYQYRDQASCSSAPYNAGCYWGSVAQTCYASSQSQCSALGGGCSWRSYPSTHRSCTANSYESACTEQGAGICTWGPR